MTHLHLDCSSGIAGDMVLGALVDAGGDFTALEAALKTLPVSGWHLERHRVERAGITATRIEVILEREEHGHRHLPEIEGHIAHSALAPRAKERAVACFRRLAQAEAGVHRILAEKVHFHEVGAVDAIIDICGAMHLVTSLGVETASAGAVNVGGGTVKCAHGLMPVPAPATAELLRGVPVHGEGQPGELATPTGAAILRTLATEYGRQPPMRVEAIGHGAGSRDFAERPNIVRAMLGQLAESGGRLPVESRRLLMVSCEIDDMTPELIAPVIEAGLAAGALDVHLGPVTMKKGRPGVRLAALVAPEQRDAVIESLFRRTSTFGVRVEEVERLALRRRMESVETPWGRVGVKVGLWGEEAIQASPEFEDCRRLAESSGVPLARVYSAAQGAAQALLGRGQP